MIIFQRLKLAEGHPENDQSIIRTGDQSMMFLFTFAEIALELITRLRIYLIIFIAVQLIVSCSPVRNLPQNQKLLVRQDVKIDNEAIKRDEVQNLILQKANQRFLGIWHLNLWVQQKTNQGTQTRFKKWLRRSAGRPPAIFNVVEMDQSTAIITEFLEGKGYFKPIVEPVVSTVGQTVAIEWKIATGKLWTIRKCEIVAEDSLIGNLVEGSRKQSLLKKGEPYNVAVLQAERERVTTFLRNEGYFSFTSDYILFEIDSSLRNWQTDVYMNIRNPRRLIGFADNREVFGKERHKKYFIDKVLVYPQYSTLRSIQSRGDFQADTT